MSQLNLDSESVHLQKEPNCIYFIENVIVIKHSFECTEQEVSRVFTA